MDQGKKGEKGEKKKLDLSVAQVSGSAIAAVVAAKLASTLGVYGTILGAGVISVIATCGGSVFQHLFKRTGEQIREVAVHAEPSNAARRTARRTARHTAPDRTQVLTTVGGPVPPPYEEEFGEATTHGTRVRGWKRSTVGAALVFLVAMGGITAYELISDQDFSGTRGTTTFGSVVRGGGGDATRPSEPAGGDEQAERRKGDTGRSPDAGQDTPVPEPTPSRSTGGDPTPTPTPPTTPTSTPSTRTPTPTASGTPSGDTDTDTGAAVQETPPAE
ncbi:hypothetical protein [Streptomyces vilmorinianum]|uniref:hypothetical protein n=1 Tax=Streptomyces vilmorinianum TaxID=3051092 RepID=UPI0020C789CA|nr:hypothetical protein [Streptomyces vilmorinianum]